MKNLHYFVTGLIGIALVVLFSIQSGEMELREQQIRSAVDSLRAELSGRIDSLNDIALGAFNPAAGGTYRLQTSIGSADTSITLASFKEPVSNLPITMTSLNSDIGYGTLNPQSATRKEFISFTGITQNADGTAQLTGVTRGLSFLSPYTASTTLRQSHAGQTIFILSDSPQLFDEYTKRRTNEWITGQWGFGVAATSSDECAQSFEYCTKNYIDALGVQGAATSSETNMGIVQLASSLQMGSSTASSTQGRPLVLLSRYSTTSPTSVGCAGGSNRGPCVVASYFQSLSNSWLSQTINYTLGFLTTTNATNTNATTTNQWFPTITGHLLKTSATGLVTAASTSTDYQAQRLVAINRTDVNPVAGAYATSTETLVIPTGLITASSTIEVKGAGSCAEGNCVVYLKLADGTTIASMGVSGPASGRTWGFSFDMLVNMTSGGVTAQQFAGFAQSVEEGTVSGIRAGDIVDAEGTSAVNFAGSQTLVVVIQGVSAGDANLTVHTITVEP